MGLRMDPVVYRDSGIGNVEHSGPVTVEDSTHKPMATQRYKSRLAVHSEDFLHNEKPLRNVTTTSPVTVSTEWPTAKDKPLPSEAEEVAPQKAAPKRSNKARKASAKK